MKAYSENVIDQIIVQQNWLILRLKSEEQEDQIHLSNQAFRSITSNKNFSVHRVELRISVLAFLRGTEAHHLCLALCMTEIDISVWWDAPVVNKYQRRYQKKRLWLNKWRSLLVEPDVQQARHLNKLIVR